jgi:4'-phosphopantetheinyl transferase
VQRWDELSSTDVHLWQAPLSPDPTTYAELAGCLTRDEHQHAQRFRRAVDRRRYVAGRGWLRTLLIGYLGYLGSESRSLTLTTNTHGKPYLDDGSLRWLRFNVAHSDDLAVYAVARDRDVGVDVERMDPTVDIDGLAQRTLCVAELRAIHGAAHEDRARAFFPLWARKEAVLKAAGIGLSVSPQQVDVRPGRLVELPSGVGNETSQWRVSDFHTQPGYAAAVAVHVGGPDVVLNVPDRALPLFEAVVAQTPGTARRRLPEGP